MRTSRLNARTTMPRSTLFDPRKTNPSWAFGPLPTTSTNRTALSTSAVVFGREPGWLNPSIVMPAVPLSISGRRLDTRMRWTPDPAMSN